MCEKIAVVKYSSFRSFQVLKCFSDNRVEIVHGVGDLGPEQIWLTWASNWSIAKAGRNKNYIINNDDYELRYPRC